MNKLIILVGESGSGKSTLEQKLVDMEIASKVISCTTRPRRDFEVQGFDYHFIDRVAFRAYYVNDSFLETTKYVMGGDKIVHYGMLKSDLSLGQGNKVCVLNPHGAEQAIEKLGKENVIVVYIKRDLKTRFIDSLKRCSSETFRETLSNAVKRLEVDDKDFAGIENKVDYVVTNDGDIEDTVHDLVRVLLKAGVTFEV